MTDLLVPQPCPSGIYAIRCTANGRVYVGSAIDIKHRWGVHRYALKVGRHHANILQLSWLKYGPCAFSWSVLEHVPNLADLETCEQRWIDRLKATDRKTGFNTCPVAGSRLGLPHTAESLAKMRAAAKGRKLGPPSPEHRAALSAAGKGRKISPETKAKMSAARKGKPLHPATRAAGIAARTGKPHSAEAKAKISAIHLGSKRSPETKAKMSAARKGRVISPESRAKMSASAKARCARKRQAKSADPLQLPLL